MPEQSESSVPSEAPQLPPLASASPIVPSSAFAPTAPSSPSSPKASPPPPIDTAAAASSSDENNRTSIVATTPAAMETAMRFDEEEVRRSMSLHPDPTTIPPTAANTNTNTITAESNTNTNTNTNMDASTAPTETAEAPAIAPPQPPVVEEETSGIVITLLLLSGARTTFTLNGGFLARHNVTHTDPMQMTVYNLKECVWRDWKEDELSTEQPTSPHLIRLILLGRLLEDKALLKDCRLNLENPNVVHLSLRPADVGEDEVTTKSGKFPPFNTASGRTGERASPGCRCVIL
ncbi:hypothetical protein TWF696_003048 [Orbilia brochopaga]|uniref:UBL3-like ubiquitin domain-containing protein n=1 Tax=Orbilia brochopaga TaxID=3140254 RepID=A0AAV9TZH2_9PEZI